MCLLKTRAVYRCNFHWMNRNYLSVKQFHLKYIQFLVRNVQIVCWVLYDPLQGLLPINVCDVGGRPILPPFVPLLPPLLLSLWSGLLRLPAAGAGGDLSCWGC